MEALGKSEHCLAASSPWPNACGASIQVIGSPFLLVLWGTCLPRGWLLLGSYPSLFS